MTVHNLKSERMQFGDIRIDRATEWGNDYAIGDRHSFTVDEARKFKRKVGDIITIDRQWAVDLHSYNLWLRMQKDPDLCKKVGALHNKRLFCWCAPLKCHGYTLLAAAKWVCDNGKN